MPKRYPYTVIKTQEIATVLFVFSFIFSYCKYCGNEEKNAKYNFYL